MSKTNYKAIAIIILWYLSQKGILIVSAFIFPYLYQFYWSEYNFRCVESNICIVDDFRSDFQIITVFFFIVILCMLFISLVFRYWLKRLIKI